MELNREMARTISEWWGEQVKRLFERDRIDKFEDILTEKILKQAKEKPYALHRDLDTILKPGKILSEAAEEAGINLYDFKRHTNVIIMDSDDGIVNSIIVRPDIFSPFIKIWPNTHEKHVHK